MLSEGVSRPMCLSVCLSVCLLSLSLSLSWVHFFTRERGGGGGERGAGDARQTDGQKDGWTNRKTNTGDESAFFGCISLCLDDKRDESDMRSQARVVRVHGPESHVLPPCITPGSASHAA